MATSAIKAFFIPAFFSLWITHGLTIFNITGIISLQILINYALAWWHYSCVHFLQEKGEFQHGEPMIAPDYPALVPILGPIISVLWDHGGFVRRLGQVYLYYLGHLTPSLMGLTSSIWTRLADIITAQLKASCDSNHWHDNISFSRPGDSQAYLQTIILGQCHDSI